MKLISIVILNWNGAELLERFLPSVIAYSPGNQAEIVVADNGSTDHSVAMLGERFPSVRIIRLDRNYGFAEGYNRAMEQIETPYTVLLNSDVEVTPGWLDTPIELLERETEAACVQPKILSQRNKAFFEYAGAAGGYIDRYGYPFCRGRLFDVVEKDEGQYDTEADITWASGACLFIRTEVYKKEGGLDSQFFAHQEEVDMCWRLRCRGYRIICTPASIVYHVGGATLDTTNPRKTFLNFRNNLLMLYKNLPDNELAKVMRIRFLLDYLAATKDFLMGHAANAKAILRARKEYKKLVPQYKEIREQNLRKTKIAFPPEMLNESLLVQFYLRGKRTFNSLSFYLKRDK